MAAKFEVGVRSDLYHAGYTEDGEAFVAERYYVFITYADGTRYAHSKVWAGCVAGYDDEYGVPYFEDVRGEAIANAEALARKVESAGTVNLAHWVRIDPEYGSEAYIRAERGIVAREKAEALEAEYWPKAA